MKLQTNTLLRPLSLLKVSELTSVVEETLDVIPAKKEKTITAAQVWSIQKGRRMFRARMFLV